MSITARRTISSALRILGVLDPQQTMKPEQADQGLEALNDLVDLMAVDSLLIYASTNLTASFSGASATVGPGGTFTTSTARPLRINHGFYRKSGIDYRITPLQTRAQYDDISQKSISTEYPEYLWYDPQVPLGTVFVWPVPAGLNAYFLNVDVLLTEFADLDTAYEVPQGYRTLLKYELARMLAAIFSVPMPESAERIRVNAMNLIKRNNTQVQKMETDTIQQEGRTYNILSNQFDG